MSGQDAKAIAEGYAESAAFYDAIWSPVILPSGKKLLGALPLDRAGRVLDIGTGTGALLQEIRAMAPKASAVGIDLTEPMLRVARDRRDATVALMDCLNLGLADATFDVAAFPFMLHYVADPTAALAEAARVVRPGGTVGTATWAEEGECAAEGIWDEELEAAGAGTDPIGMPEYLELMDTPEKVEAVLTDAGLDPGPIWLDENVYRWPRNDFLTFLSYGARRRRLHTLEEPARDEVMRRVRTRLDALDEDGWAYSFTIVLAIAHCP
jgi:SAM-dependent methyltransferase